ncbi:hypothetical protein ACFQXA_21270 [Nocardiopsis composta]
MSSVLRMTNGDMDDVLAMLGPAPLDDEQRRGSPTPSGPPPRSTAGSATRASTWGSRSGPRWSTW